MGCIPAILLRLIVSVSVSISVSISVSVSVSVEISKTTHFRTPWVSYCTYLGYV